MSPNPSPRRGAQRTKRALILSGGGAFGAYEAGVIHALARGQSPATGYRPICPRILTGTSVGAYCATYLASRWDRTFQQATQELLEIWLDILGQQPGSATNGVFRFRFNPSEFLDPRKVLGHPTSVFKDACDDIRHVGPILTKAVQIFLGPNPMDLGTRLASLLDVSGFVSTQPLAHSIAKTIDFSKVVRSPFDLSIAATLWKSDTVLMAYKKALNALQGSTLIQASAAIPGLFAPKFFDNEPLVDGGVVLNTPFGPAVQAGANELFVASVPPRMDTVPLTTASTLGTLVRLQDAAWAQQLMVALTLVRFCNTLLSQPSHPHTQQNNAATLVRYFDSNFAARDTLRPLTVHLFRPSESLGGGPLGILDFDRSQIERLIHLATLDTQNHDCLRSGCILAGDPTTFTPATHLFGTVIGA